jgi:hypothetical protein
MTKDEALTLALEALELALSDDQPYIVKCGEAITAIKEALAQPEQEPEFAYVMEAGEDRWKKLLIQERNFCQRCGKRLADLTAIHTCTPPAQA